MRNAFIGFLATVAVGIGAGPASAQPTSQLGQWMCSVLNEDFEPEAAIKSFPLEKLGPVKQTRKTNDDRVSVEFVAEGDYYEVTYSYTYKVEDVDSRYGFELVVDPQISGDEADNEAMLWLAEFGTPVRDTFGFSVGGGPKMAGGDSYPFNFAIWDSGMMRAEWFYQKDIRRAASVCAAAKPPSPELLAALDPTKGRAVDRKTDKVSLWYCSVLNDSFDPVAAMAAFPLEKLGAPVESRDKDDDYVRVELEAEGDDFSVTYGYSYSTDDVDERYGFMLAITPASFSVESEEEAMAWLRGFGVPKKNLIGYAVGAGQGAFDPDDPPFKFSVWMSSGRRLAEWFEPRDIRRAQTLCQ